MINWRVVHKTSNLQIKRTRLYVKEVANYDYQGEHKGHTLLQTNKATLEVRSKKNTNLTLN